MALKVPFCGTVRRGTHGPHVVAYKRALSRNGVMQWPKKGRNFTQIAGEHMERAIAAFQAKKKIPISGIIGKRTHDELVASHRKAPYQKEWAFDQFAIDLMKAYRKELDKEPEAERRADIVSAWHYWWAHRNLIGYAMSRPFPVVKPPKIPAVIDCSGFVTTGHFAGGAEDPNGRDFDGQGYTGTLLAFGTPCSYLDLEAADAVMYGYTTSPSPAFPVGSPTHTAGFDGKGGVYSHGKQADPAHVPARYRKVNCYVHFEVKER